MKVKAKSDFYLDETLVKAGEEVEIDKEELKRCIAADVIDACEEDEETDGSKDGNTTSTGTTHTGGSKETSKNRRK